MAFTEWGKLQESYAPELANDDFHPLPSAKAVARLIKYDGISNIQGISWDIKGEYHDFDAGEFEVLEISESQIMVRESNGTQHSLDVSFTSVFYWSRLYQINGKGHTKMYKLGIPSNNEFINIYF